MLPEFVLAFVEFLKKPTGRRENMPKKLTQKLRDPVISPGDENSCISIKSGLDSPLDSLAGIHSSGVFLVAASPIFRVRKRSKPS